MLGDHRLVSTEQADRARDVSGQCCRWWDLGCCCAGLDPRVLSVCPSEPRAPAHPRVPTLPERSLRPEPVPARTRGCAGAECHLVGTEPRSADTDTARAAPGTARAAIPAPAAKSPIPGGSAATLSRSLISPQRRGYSKHQQPARSSARARSCVSFK